MRRCSHSAYHLAIGDLNPAIMHQVCIGGVSHYLENLQFLMYPILYIARSSNGRTGAFEASNLGSIPSLAAKFLLCLE